jgi:hypothetical protein
MFKKLQEKKKRFSPKLLMGNCRQVAHLIDIWLIHVGNYILRYPFAWEGGISNVQKVLATSWV